MEYFLDGLVDYCWAGDNWLMMLDLSFCCALNTHTRAYFHLSSRLIVVFGQYDYPCYGYRDVWLILTDSLLYIGYPYWGIFPFHLVEMSPYFELGHFHQLGIPDGVCWDDISSSGALLSSLTVFTILSSICGEFLRWTSGLMMLDSFFVVHQISTLGHISPFSEILICSWVVWLSVILIIEMFDWC